MGVQEKEASQKVPLAAAEATAPNEASDNASTTSAPPYMPNALPLSSDSAQLAARLYPMISNVLPNPAAM